MRKSTVLLSITTAVFAASTLYLALQLRTRDAAVTQTSTASSSPLEATGGAVRAAEATGRMDVAPARVAGAPAPGAPAPGSATATIHGADPAAPAKREGTADATAMFARQQLARLEDPVQRSALLEDARANTRRQYARLRDQLKLSESTFEQLVTLVAEQSLQSQETYFRCAADPACNIKENFKRNPVDDRSQELLALLGADQADELRKYQASLGERDAVAQLRGRLNESNSMRDAQAEALVLALADERDRFQKETAARGSTLEGWGTTLGMIMYSADSNSIDQRLAEAASYSQRLRQRAGAVLSPAQLAAFNQMQDELLAQMAAYLRPTSILSRQRA
jgi:hypothetical protein